MNHYSTLRKFRSTNLTIDDDLLDKHISFLYQYYHMKNKSKLKKHLHDSRIHAKMEE